MFVHYSYCLMHLDSYIYFLHLHRHLRKILFMKRSYDSYLNELAKRIVEKDNVLKKWNIFYWISEFYLLEKPFFKIWLNRPMIKTLSAGKFYFFVNREHFQNISNCDWCIDRSGWTRKPIISPKSRVITYRHWSLSLHGIEVLLW